MVPAATIGGRLLDGTGRPIASHYVSVGADQLPPSSSVLATMKTDAAGRFCFSELPASPVWLTIRSPENMMHEVRTETLDCEAGRVYEVELTYRASRLPNLTMRITPAPRSRAGSR